MVICLYVGIMVIGIAAFYGYRPQDWAVEKLGIRQDQTWILFTEDGCQTINTLTQKSICSTSFPHVLGPVRILSDLFGEVLIETKEGDHLVLPRTMLKARMLAARTSRLFLAPREDI